ncbi:ABC transporter substrate-binding protein [Streptomyces sp. NPDC058045]|uniref:ABC transporter substrate-binding protein n=1 Tax=Streptomyces sp. NPDC058045 TaxID=3346311 RepID=UPI0036E3C7D1
MPHHPQCRQAVAGLAAGALALTVLAAAGCAAGEDKHQGGEDLVIGASLELSGPTASIGTTYRQALELEVDRLNRSGPPGGRKIRLVIRDNKTTPQQNIANVKALVEHDKVDALITGACSACMVPVAPIVEHLKMPTVSLASASAITEPVTQRHYTFKISPSPAQDAAVLVSALKQRRIKTIGLINVDNVYGEDGRRSVTQRAEAAGIRIISRQRFEQDDQDMSPQVGKLAEARPDAIVVWAVMPAAGIIAKNTKDSGYKGGLYLDAGAGAELFVKGAGTAVAEGTRMVFPRVLAIEDVADTSDYVAEQKRWVKDYRDKYGAYSGFASFAADAARMIADAGADTDSREALRDALEKEAFDGLSGRIQNTAEQHSGIQAQSLALLEVRNGEWHIAR